MVEKVWVLIGGSIRKQLILVFIFFKKISQIFLKVCFIVFIKVNLLNFIVALPWALTLTGPDKELSMP